MLMYWAVAATYFSTEWLIDFFLSWLPFYYELKMLMFYWLLSPQYKGASTIYKNYLEPYLLTHENTIDHRFDQYKNLAKSAVMKQIGTVRDFLMLHLARVIEIGKKIVVEVVAATMSEQLKKFTSNIGNNGNNDNAAPVLNNQRNEVPVAAAPQTQQPPVAAHRAISPIKTRSSASPSNSVNSAIDAARARFSPSSGSSHHSFSPMSASSVNSLFSDSNENASARSVSPSSNGTYVSSRRRKSHERE